MLSRSATTQLTDALLQALHEEQGLIYHYCAQKARFLYGPSWHKAQT